MATDPLQLERDVKALRARLNQNRELPADVSLLLSTADCTQQGLVAGLISDFGLGGNPELRRALYLRLQRLEVQHGQKAEILIAEARSMAKAPTVRSPGNYFARAVLLKLREAGLV